MITTILNYLPYLGAAVLTNILLGVYHNVENLKESFSIKKLLTGAIKALIVSAAFISTSYVFDKLGFVMDLEGYELKPDVLLISAVALYLGKSLENLKNILGVETLKDIETDEIIKIERNE